jgi:hypothetical protein
MVRAPTRISFSDREEHQASDDTDGIRGSQALDAVRPFVYLER